MWVIAEIIISYQCDSINIKSQQETKTKGVLGRGVHSRLAHSFLPISLDDFLIIVIISKINLPTAAVSPNNKGTAYMYPFLFLWGLWKLWREQMSVLTWKMFGETLQWSSADCKVDF